MILQLGQTQLIQDLLIAMESSIAFLCFEFFIVLLFQYKSEYKEEQDISEDIDPDAYRYFKDSRKLKIGWAVFFLSLSFGYIFMIMSSYFTTDNIWELIWKYGSYLSFTSAIVILSNNFNYRGLRIGLSIYLVGGFLMCILTPFEYVRGYFSLIWPISAIFIIKYTHSILKKLHGADFQSKPLLFILLGLIFSGIGFLFTTDYIYFYLGIYSKLIGVVIQFFSVISLSGIIYLLPPLSEYDWKGKIKQLFILTPAGITIYDKNFETPDNTGDAQADIAGSAIMVLKMLIETMIKEGKNLESINKTYATMSFVYGKYVIGCVVTDKKSRIINDKVKYFVRDFEKAYAKSLEFYTGSISEYKESDKILEKYFPE